VVVTAAVVAAAVVAAAAVAAAAAVSEEFTWLDHWMARLTA
jgi:hypothetical protein